MSTALARSGRRGALIALVGAALIATLLLALPAAVQAHRGEPPEFDCAAAPNVNQEGWGDACFEFEGDEHWVRDQTRNGWSVRVQIQTDYGKIRWCANTHGADSWHRCDFNHREFSCLTWRMFEQRGRKTRKWTEWAAWHDVKTGAADISCNDIRVPRGDCMIPLPHTGIPAPGPCAGLARL